MRVIKMEIGNKCQICGKRENLMTCSRCKNVHYCSKACQKKDWDEIPKKICNTPIDIVRLHQQAYIALYEDDIQQGNVIDNMTNCVKFYEQTIDLKHSARFTALNPHAKNCWTSGEGGVEELHISIPSKTNYQYRLLLFGKKLPV